MTAPRVLFGDDCREGMLKGFETMARLLGLTLGPAGGQIVSAYGLNGNRAEVLSDAATVARRVVELPGRAENAGAMLMRHLAWRVRQEAGDGSATTAVLAGELAQAARRLVMSGTSPMVLREGIQQATNAAVGCLSAMSQPVTGEERIAAQALAGCGDGDIARLVGEIYDVLGPNGAVAVERYRSVAHDRQYLEGARYTGGYLSSHFITDANGQQAVLDHPFILVTDAVLDTAEQVVPALQQVVAQGGGACLVICKSVAGTGLATLITNHQQEVVRCCAVALKTVGELRQGLLADIAVLTGARFLDESAGLSPRGVRLGDLGRAERVIASRDEFAIIGGQGQYSDVQRRKDELQGRMVASTDSEGREQSRRRLATLSGGSALLKIGAMTDPEWEHKRALAAQALSAARLGVEGGAVPGGGVAFRECISAVRALTPNGDGGGGAQVVARALEAPMRVLIAKAGLPVAQIMLEARRCGPGYGCDVRTGEIVDMASAGIMDATKVLQSALTVAASGVSMLLTTETLILRREPWESLEP